jgi:transketolase
MSSSPSRRTLANAIRALTMDAVQKANSGHPGMPMGMADIAEVLWNDFLRCNPTNPTWLNRDRFIVSNGHGSLLQYALLHLTGFELSITDLKQFRQLHSKTPGHPEYGYTPGVETTTGPLGQGLANAVGMALAEAVLAAEFNREGHDIIDHDTYCFVGDGCLMEGISHEVASLAGTLRLGKLIVFWDDNGISIDGKVSGWCTEDTPKRFAAYGWHVIPNVAGHDATEIAAAIQEARDNRDKPSLICCKTKIGFGAPTLEGTEKIHGQALGLVEIAGARQKLEWPYEPFFIPEEIYAAWDAKEKGQALEEAWQRRFKEYQVAYPELALELIRRLQGTLKSDLTEKITSFILNSEKRAENIPTRKASQNILELLTAAVPELFGGSADLSHSTLTQTTYSKPINFEPFKGNYVFYGVREFGMSAMMNGLALYGGFIPYGGTFLVFSDYSKNALRLAALMGIRVIFVFTHDSIGVGEDGPTHQPIEQLATLRNMPNMSLWRPSDATETAVAWQMAITRTEGPTSIVLSRQTTVHHPKTAAQIDDIYKGAYVLVDCPESVALILLATGSEVSLAVAAAQHLQATGVNVRVVSMPSTDLFQLQTKAYQEKVLPRQVKARIAIEAASTNYWYQWVGLDGAVVGIDQYGESAPASEIYEALGITIAKIVKLARALLEKTSEKEAV